MKIETIVLNTEEWECIDNDDRFYKKKGTDIIIESRWWGGPEYWEFACFTNSEKKFMIGEAGCGHIGFNFTSKLEIKCYKNCDGQIDFTKEQMNILNRVGKIIN